MLELRDQRAYWRGQRVELTLRDLALVRLLFTADGRDVSYRQCYDVTRGKNFVAGHGADGFRANVISFIKRIRKKFKDVDPSFNAIENYPSFGYRWREGPVPMATFSPDGQRILTALDARFVQFTDCQLREAG